MSKEVIIGNIEIYNGGKIIKGYNPTAKYCFIRLIKKNSNKIKEVRCSVPSHILKRTNNPSDFYQKLNNFIEDEKCKGFGATLYALADEEKEKNNNAHCLDNLLHWQNNLNQSNHF
jgi:hypothetical protein